MTYIPLILGTECGCGDINLPGATECEGCGAPLGCECVHCRAPLALHGGHQKFCSDRCRKRESRGAARPVQAKPEPAAPVDPMRQWWLERKTAEEIRDLSGWAA